jgi:plastocyanin
MTAPFSTLAAFTAAAAVLAACRAANSAQHAPAQSSATPAAARSSPASAAPVADTITIMARDYAFDAPSTVPAGRTTIRLINRGPAPHNAQLVKLDSGKTVDDFLAALRAGGPPPRWASMAGGPNAAQSGSSSNATVMLAPGTYAITCFIPTREGVPHIMKGMVRPLQVTASSRATAPAPAADDTVKLVDYAFQFAHPLTSGRHTIRVVNDGAQPHEIALVRLEPGASPTEFAQWALHQTGPEPGTMLGGVTGIMPGMHASFTVDLPPGTYGVLCFLPDAKDGKPHVAHGMEKQITVS